MAGGLGYWCYILFIYCFWLKTREPHCNVHDSLINSILWLYISFILNKKIALSFRILFRLPPYS